MTGVTISHAPSSTAGNNVRFSDFSKRSSGKLVATVYDEKAFVQNPLPPLLDFARLAIPPGDAASKVGELKGACRARPGGRAPAFEPYPIDRNTPHGN